MGDAPWALSALPECFEQEARRSGSVAFARVLLVGSRRIVRGTIFRVADCTVAVDNDSATVTRGENHLRIPRPTRFFGRGNKIIVERRDGIRDDVRVFSPRRMHHELER